MVKTVTGKTISLVAKQVNSARQVTLRITGVKSGVMKLVTVTIQPKA
jgi:hypothetical protein